MIDTFSLKVFHPGAALPTEVVSCASASDVLKRIPTLLEKHPDCWIIQVYANELKLFSVDCTGSTIHH